MTTAAGASGPSPGRAHGRIITFYSYKGGTGRSMALANVAWILASTGSRVLVVDWDFEAPGLHRYFRPFLPDPELAESPGLVDFFLHFSEAARLEARTTTAVTARTSDEAETNETTWFAARADLLRYSIPLDHEFPGNGALDFVGAGQQGPSYGSRVNSFAWGEFYEKLGGGTFLEAVKARMREQYDYVLIDSRTGLSDTSGICTVQMPDELVVCFTLNRQSIFGAAAIANSVDAQRRLSNGAPGVRIWPVPTRVELHEKDRLEAARRSARDQFAPFLWHLPRKARSNYWSEIEVLYFPYYAYEEVLATIADIQGPRTSLLDSMHRLTGQLTRGKGRQMPRLDPGVRARLLAQFNPPMESGSSSGGRFFLSYAVADRSQRTLTRLATAINQHFGSGTAFSDQDVPLGANLREALNAGLDASDAIIVLVGPRWGESRGSPYEIDRMLKQGKPVIPVLLDGARADLLPQSVRGLQYVSLNDATFDDDVQRFLTRLTRSLPTLTAQRATVNPDDPIQGQFGAAAERNGRKITARVHALSDDWFRIELTVRSTAAPILAGDVEFHLHPTFRPSVVRVSADEGSASTSVVAWGAFTVGVVTDEGRTRLELDLSDLRDAPRVFRER